MRHDEQTEQVRQLFRRGPDLLKLVGGTVIILVVAQVVAGHYWPPIAGFLRLASMVGVIVGMILYMMRKNRRL